MSDYDNTNSGALFLNNNRKTDKHPDLTGTININGKDMWISGWTKVAKSGKRAGQRYVSLAVNEMDEQPSNPGSIGSILDDINGQLP